MLDHMIPPDSCPCYDCILIPMCKHKEQSQMLKACAFLRGFLVPIYDQYVEWEAYEITVNLPPLDRILMLSKSSLFYWTHYPKRGYVL